VFGGNSIVDFLFCPVSEAAIKIAVSVLTLDLDALLNCRAG
jgi:hypothetical protein